MMRNALLSTCLLVMSGLLVTSDTSAQDMSFEAEEAATEAAAAVPEETEPSEVLANALRLYQAQSYSAAAVQFQRVLDGESGDGPGNQQRAQFFLGKCFYQMRYYQSAFSVFDEITQAAAGHRYFNESLQWLAQLAYQLPETAGVIERIGRYGVHHLEQFNTPETRDVYMQLIFLMGRYQYGQGEFQDAVDLFGRIDASMPQYIDAKFFEGIANVRMRRARPAIVAFRAILDGLDSVEIENEERMRNLAWLSLARVYYTAANRVDPETGEHNINGQFLGQAVEAWNQIEPDSEYWLDALFESSWAFFLADEYSRALGNVHTLNSPYFPQAYYPEGVVIKAVTFFVNCQLENAEAMIQLFHTRYDPVRTQLDTTLAQFEDNASFFEFLKAVRAGTAELPENIRGLVASALSDRTVVRHLEYVAILESEETRLNAEPADFLGSAVGGRIMQDIALAKSFAQDGAGDIARGRYNRLIQELQDLSNQVDAVDLEIATYRRGELGTETSSELQAVAGTSGGNVVVDEEHQMWPFDGEYWRDELGYYRQQVTNRCSR